MGTDVSEEPETLNGCYTLEQCLQCAAFHINSTLSFPKEERAIRVLQTFNSDENQNHRQHTDAHPGLYNQRPTTYTAIHDERWRISCGSFCCFMATIFLKLHTNRLPTNAFMLLQ